MTEELLKLGHDVRAFVRVDDDRAAELRDLGAQVIVGDLLKQTISAIGENVIIRRFARWALGEA